MIHAAELQYNTLHKLSLLKLRWSLLCSCCLTGPASSTPCCSDGWEWWGGASTISPPLRTNMDEPFDLALPNGSKEISRSQNPPLKRHLTRHLPSSSYPHFFVWNKITCVLFVRWGEWSSRWDRMENVEEWIEDENPARVCYCLSTGILSLSVSCVSWGDFSASHVETIKSILKNHLLIFTSRAFF